MDVRKVLEKINLILDVEDQHNLQNLFNNIFAHYSGNAPDPLRQEKDTITQVIENSEISNFGKSDIGILEGIGIRGYFDLEALEKLDEMLSAPGYEAQSQIQEFVSKRVELVKRIRALQSSLQGLDIEPEEAEEKYQFVISLPGKYRDLDELEDFLGDVKQILNALNSKIKGAPVPRIISVNNGSIELFIEVALELAKYLWMIIERLLTIYDVIERLKKFREGGQVLKKKRRVGVNKMADQELEEEKQEILTELIKKLPVKTDEEKNHLRILVDGFVKHLENGVSVEIKTPAIEEPEEPSDEDDAPTQKRKKEALKRFEEKKAMDEQNRRLFLAQQEGFKLELPPGPPGDDNPPEDDESSENDEEH